MSDAKLSNCDGKFYYLDQNMMMPFNNVQRSQLKITSLQKLLSKELG